MTKEDRGRLAGVGRTLIGTSAGVLASALVGFGRNLSRCCDRNRSGWDAYNVANQVPAQIFPLIRWGTLAVLFVPRNHAACSHVSTTLRRIRQFPTFRQRCIWPANDLAIGRIQSADYQNHGRLVVE